VYRQREEEEGEGREGPKAISTEGRESRSQAYSTTPKEEELGI
jgi:hypothetical protein